MAFIISDGKSLGVVTAKHAQKDKIHKNNTAIVERMKAETGTFYCIIRISIFDSLAYGKQTDHSDVNICVDLAVPYMPSLVISRKTSTIVRIRRKRNLLPSGHRHIAETKILEENIYA